MGLGAKLFRQSLKVVIITVSITVAAGLLFGYIYSRITNRPAGLAGEGTKVIILQDDIVVFASNPITKMTAQEILMSLKMERSGIEIEGVLYSILNDSSQTIGSERYRVIKLSPVFDLSGYYNSLSLFVITVFIVSFLLSVILIQRFFKKSVTVPAKALKKAAEKLRDGELDVSVPQEGEGEIAELCRAVEELRVRLKESVYIKEKYDENRKFLISSISHDLKTPVTAIRGYVEGVLDGVTDTPEKTNKYLKAAIDKTSLINSMIEDLLLYSRLDLNQLPFDLERVEIHKFMSVWLVGNELAFQKEDKRLGLIDEIGGPRYVLIDINKFNRVMQNILDNAGRHIKKGVGRVDIVLRESAVSVIIEVKDNGPGIHQEDLPYVFDRFYKAGASRGKEGVGGLGLAIAKQIVEGMGGRIWATSPGGASIIISLGKAGA